MSEYDELLSDLEFWCANQERAADAIRALLRERDALIADRDSWKQQASKFARERDFWHGFVEQIKRERDEARAEVGRLRKQVQETITDVSLGFESTASILARLRVALAGERSDG